MARGWEVVDDVGIETPDGSGTFWSTNFRNSRDEQLPPGATIRERVPQERIDTIGDREFVGYARLARGTQVRSEPEGLEPFLLSLHDLPKE